MVVVSPSLDSLYYDPICTLSPPPLYPLSSLYLLTSFYTPRVISTTSPHSTPRASRDSQRERLKPSSTLLCVAVLPALTSWRKTRATEGVVSSAGEARGPDLFYSFQFLPDAPARIPAQLRAPRPRSRQTEVFVAELPTNKRCGRTPTPSPHPQSPRPPSAAPPPIPVRSA